MTASSTAQSDGQPQPQEEQIEAFLDNDEIQQIITPNEDEKQERVDQSTASDHNDEAATDMQMSSASDQEDSTIDPEAMTDQQAHHIQKVQSELQEILAKDDSIQGFFSHQDSVFCVGLSPTEPHIAVTGDGAENADTAYVWNTKTGELIHTLKGHSDSVVCCGFSADGKLIATAGMDACVRIWRADTGELKHTLQGPQSSCECLAWHSTGQVVLCGAEDGTAWLFNAASGEFMQCFVGHADAVTCCAFSADGRLILTASADGTLRVWLPSTGKAIRTMERTIQQHAGETLPPITAMAVKPIGHPAPATPAPRIVCVGAVSGALSLVNVDTGHVLLKLSPHSESVESISFCPHLETPLLASTSVDGTVHIHDLNSGQRRVTIRHGEAVTCCAWVDRITTNNGTQRDPLILTASCDATIRLSDARSGQLIHTFKGHQESILAMAVDPQQTRIVTASDDHTSLVFDLESQLREAKQEAQPQPHLPIQAPAASASLSSSESIPES